MMQASPGSRHIPWPVGLSAARELAQAACPLPTGLCSAPALVAFSPGSRAWDWTRGLNNEQSKSELIKINFIPVVLSKKSVCFRSHIILLIFFKKLNVIKFKFELGLYVGVEFHIWKWLTWNHNSYVQRSSTYLLPKFKRNWNTWTAQRHWINTALTESLITDYLTKSEIQKLTYQMVP